MKTGNKVMRKVKGMWVAVALFGLLGAVVPSQVILAANDEVIEYQEQLKAKDYKVESWEELTEDEIKDNIIKQIELGLDEYVIEWGDTLPNIVKLLDLDEDELKEFLELNELKEWDQDNGIDDVNVIYVGDTLKGVFEAFIEEFPELELELNVADAPQTSQPVAEKPVAEKPVAEKPVAEKPVAEKPVETKPEVPETPETPEVPETPETPEVPETPETPEVPETPETPEVPETPETPEVPETPETPEVPETPETPEVPETPETPEVPETPETPLEEGDTLVKERHWLDTTTEVVSTDANYEGRDGEDVINGDVSSTVQENSWEEQGEDVLTKETVVETVTETQIELVPETRIELVPETTIVQESQEVLVGEDEEGNPIYETQLVDVEVTNMVETEITEMVEKEVQVEVDVEVEKDVWVAGAIKYFNQVITTITQAFDQHIIYDSSLDEGVVEVEQAGVNGVVTEDVTTVTEDGVVIDVVETSNVVSEMTPEIKRVGTRKHVSNTVVVNEHTVHEFGVIERATNSMYVGDTEVSQAGVNGIRTVVKEQLVGLDGEVLSETVVSNNVLEPVDKIVLVGTKPVYTTSTRTQRETLDLQVETKYVDSEEEYTKVLTPGVQGVVEHTYTVEFERGVEVGSTLTNTSVVTEGVKQVVEVGKGNIERRQRTEQEVIAYETVEKLDTKLSKGDKKVVQEGVDGSLAVVFEDLYIDGKLVRSTEVSREVTKPAVDEIIHVGALNEEIKERVEESVIKHTTQVIEDDTLLKGKTVVEQQGVDGSVRKVYKDTYHNGELVSSELVDTVTVEAKAHITRVGTKEEPVSDDVIIVYKKGDKIGEYTLTEDVSFNVSDLVNESDEAKYQKAQREDNLHNTKGKDESGMTWRIGIRMDEATVDAFNEGTIFDHSIFNARMLELVNELRQSVGSSVLEHAEVELQGAADIRAQEMADYGSLRFENQPHTRPDGTSWQTALPKDRNYGTGENIAQRSHHQNFYTTLSETALAEKFFNQWKNSSGHYANMIRPNYTGFATAVRIGTGVTPAQGDSVFNNLIAVQLFKTKTY